MSSIRSRHSLGGTDGLAEDPIPKLRLHGVPHHQVDAAAEDLLEAALHPEEVKQSDRAVERDEQVDVTSRRSLATRHRAEDLERTDAQLGELGSLLGEAPLDLFPGHDVILRDTCGRGQRRHETPPGMPAGPEPGHFAAVALHSSIGSTEDVKPVSPRTIELIESLSPPTGLLSRWLGRGEPPSSRVLDEIVSSGELEAALALLTLALAGPTSHREPLLGAVDRLVRAAPVGDLVWLEQRARTLSDAEDHHRRTLLRVAPRELTDRGVRTPSVRGHSACIRPCPRRDRYLLCVLPLTASSR